MNESEPNEGCLVLGWEPLSVKNVVLLGCRIEMIAYTSLFFLLSCCDENRHQTGVRRSQDVELDKQNLESVGMLCQSLLIGPFLNDVEAFS